MMNEPTLFDTNQLPKRCPTCRGTGQVRMFGGGYTTCPPCDGTGRLVIPEPGPDQIRANEQLDRLMRDGIPY